MTTTTGSEQLITTPVSARVFLYGEDSLGQLREQLADSDVLHGAGVAAGAVGSAARSLLNDQLAPIAASFLDVDLGAVAAAGWQRHGDLVAAARDTRATPGLRMVLDLASHRIEGTWQPRVDVLLGPSPVAHLGFGLTVAFDVTCLSVVVFDGRLVQLGGGRCRGEVSFAIGGKVLGSRSAQFDPAFALPLGAGLALPTAAGTGPAVEAIHLPTDAPEPVLLPSDRRQPAEPSGW